MNTLKFFFILSLGWFIVTPFYAQDKTLSLKESVTGRFTTLSPAYINDLQWRKGSDTYSFISEKESALMEGSVNKSNDRVLVDMTELKKAVEKYDTTQLNTIPSIQWVSKDEFVFEHQFKKYVFNIKNRGCEMLLQYEALAENMDFESKQKNLAYTKENNLYIAFKGGGILPVTQDTEGIINGQAAHRSEFGITKGTFWSPKGNYLAFYHQDESRVTDYPLVDISTTPATLNNIKYPMAGQKSHETTLGIYDIKNQTTVYLQTGEPKEKYLTCVTWGPNEEDIYIALVNRDQNHVILNKYNAKTGEKIKTLFEEKDEKYIEPEHELVFLPHKPNEFLWFSERDGFTALYHYDTEGNLIGQLTKGKWVVQKVLGFGNNHEVYITGTGINPTEQHIYAVDMSLKQTKPLSTVAAVHDGMYQFNGKYIIDSYSSISIPHVINLIDTKGKVIKNLLTADNPLKEYKTGTTEIFSIPAEDGTLLYCRMIKPSHFDANKKYPVLVYVYGGPRAQLVTNSWVAAAPLWMHYMAEQGYIVFSLDNRGSNNRGIAFEQATFRQLGTIELQDQMTGVNYLKKQSYIDSERMAVHGWSFGGFMTVSLMLRQPETFKVGVAGGPVIDWNYYEIMYTEKYMDSPQTNHEGYKIASLLNYVKNLKGDLLLIHGTVDDVVVMQHSMSFLKKCVDEGIQVDFFVYPGHPHNVRGKDRAHLMEKVLKYIMEKN